jgi:hypothetical protein
MDATLDLAAATHDADTPEMQRQSFVDAIAFHLRNAERLTVLAAECLRSSFPSRRWKAPRAIAEARKRVVAAQVCARILTSMPRGEQAMGDSFVRFGDVGAADPVWHPELEQRLSIIQTFLTATFVKSTHWPKIKDPDQDEDEIPF